MGYYAVYAVRGREQPVDGDQIASNSGWLRWAAYLAHYPRDYPLLAWLSETGEAYPPERLEDELVRCIGHHDTPPEVQSVAKQILRATRERPAGTVAILVS